MIVCSYLEPQFKARKEIQANLLGWKHAVGAMKYGYRVFTEYCESNIYWGSSIGLEMIVFYSAFQGSSTQTEHQTLDYIETYAKTNSVILTNVR